MKILIVFFTFILCLDLSAQKEQVHTCKWVDKASGEVLPSSSDYVSTRKGAFYYAFSNDENNLYVDFKVTESIDQGKVLQMGLILWLNTDGKSRKITGVRYPIGAKFSRPRGRGETLGTINQETPLSLANTIELIGFKDISPNRFPSSNTESFRGSVKYDSDGNLLYSMTIPLALLPAGGKNPVERKALMNIGIEYGAPPQFQNQAGPRGGSFEPPSGGGGGRRGGGGGAGARGAGAAPGPGFAGNEDLPKPVLIWVKNIALAEKK